MVVNASIWRALRAIDELKFDDGLNDFGDGEVALVVAVGAFGTVTRRQDVRGLKCHCVPNEPRLSQVVRSEIYEAVAIFVVLIGIIATIAIEAAGCYALDFQQNSQLINIICNLIIL